MKSDFPNCSQFSPTQTPLPMLLEIVKANQPEREKIKIAIGENFFKTSSDKNIANNTIFALSEYQILDKPTDDLTYAQLTSFGEALYDLSKQEKYEEMYSLLAQHILLNLNGLELIQTVDDLVSRGTKITKQTISKELGYRGFHIPRNGTHLNGMRQWLEKANVVNPRMWEAKPEKVQQLLGGITHEELDDYAQLTREQRAFALAFARLNQDVAQSNSVADYAETLFGVEFPEGGLPQSTLFPLQDVGLLTCEKTTSGQGAKPYLVRPTEKLKQDFLEPIFEMIENSAGIQYRKLIRMPYDDILKDLNSASKHIKGLALEALSFYLGRLLGLNFVKWRLRSNITGGAELDVIMEGAHLIFSRWQIQCKNSKQARLDDIAKEVGIANLIRTNVIMIVTTGKIGGAARAFAEQIMRETNFQIILLQKSHLDRIKENPGKIAMILTQQSEKAMALKRNQLDVL